MLNREGVTGRRGQPFSARTIRTIVHNAAYKGEKGYPALIEPERYDAILAGLARLDPAFLQKRQGGRRPRDESYVLGGLSFCRRCGASMWTRRQAIGRVYVCAHRRRSTGLCNAEPVPADLIESHVLDHLHWFIGSVEDWIGEQVAECADERREREAALERDRARLTDLDRLRERHLAEYRRQVEAGASVTYTALEEIERIDRERNALLRNIEEAEAIVSEWAGPPDVDAALDYYGRLVDLVQGKVKQAEGAADLNRALHEVLAGLWIELVGDRLEAEFRLRVTDEPDGLDNGLRQVLMRSVGERRIKLPLGVDRPRAFDPDSIDCTPELDRACASRTTRRGCWPRSCRSNGRCLNRDLHLRIASEKTRGVAIPPMRVPLSEREGR